MLQDLFIKGQNIKGFRIFQFFKSNFPSASQEGNYSASLMWLMSSFKI